MSTPLNYDYLPCVQCGEECLDHRDIDYVEQGIGDISVLCFKCSHDYILLPTKK